METQHSNYQFSEEKKNNNSDEINLVDYFLVLWRRKMMMISIFLVVVTTAIVINLLLPLTFESKALLRIGTFRSVPIESLSDITTIFYSDKILAQINERLDLGVKNLKVISGLFSIKDTSKDSSNFIQIKATGDSPEKAQQRVKVVIELLLERHNQLFKEAEAKFNFEIELIKREQEQTNFEIAKKEQEIQRLVGDIAFYEQEIQKRANIQSEGQGRIVESYIGLLASAKSQRENDLLELNSLNFKLTNFDVRFQEKEFEKKYETMVTVVEIEPSLPQIKIAPDRRKNVTSAAVLGLFLGILWAFGVEYYSQIRGKFIGRLNKYNNL